MKSQAPPLQQVDRTYVLYRNRKLTYFGGCDYFRLSSHPAVLVAIQSGLKKYGLTVAASRKTTGNHPLYEKLEEKLAGFFDAPAAVSLSNGYATNLVVAQTLAGTFSHVLLDEKAHASLVDAAVFFDCPIIRFPYRDAVAVSRIVRRIGQQSRPVLLTDGMFSHDGQLAPIGDYLSALPRDAVILLDDAHAAGTLGKTGKGTGEQLGVRSPCIIQTISLGKAFGVYGGAVLGSRTLCNRIRERSPLFGGNTPPPLPLANAVLRAVQIMSADKSLRRRLERNVRYVKGELCRTGLTIADTPSPIISVVPRRARDVARLTKPLLARQIYPSFIRYPGGAASGYFRFAISSEHSPEQLGNLVRVLSEYAGGDGK
ncbi:MAG: hypothetical protein DME19_20370 [Verrucomicrobia bacterium]|nr:MAG: hypothetical protein DME19_20370 [Verrucomicrobiota bacterium]